MTGAGANPVTLVPIGGGVFRRVDDRGLVAFDAIDQHGPRRLIVDGGGLRVYERISALSTPPVQGVVFVAMALAFPWPALRVRSTSSS